MKIKPKANGNSTSLRGPFLTDWPLADPNLNPRTRFEKMACGCSPAICAPSSLHCSGPRGGPAPRPSRACCESLVGELWLAAAAPSCRCARCTAARPHSAKAYLAQLHRAGLSRATLLDAPLLGCRVPPEDGMGNEFVLEEGAELGDAASTSGAAVFVGGLPTASGQPGFRAEDRRSHDGAAGHSTVPEPLRPLGLRSIDIVVPPPLLPAVAAFWERTMCARVAPECESHPTGFRVLVDGACSRANSISTDALVGAQWLRFIGGTRRAYDGHHIALYVRDFVGTFERALAAQVLFDNARYSDRGGTLELALENRQFRTLCMHPATTTVPTGVCSSDRCFQLELEVRAFDHPACPL